MKKPGKTFAREVAHKLTDDEALELHDRAQKLEQEANKLEAELKEETKERRAQVVKLRTEASRTRAAAKERKEMRAVQCYEELRGSQVFAIRVDTGEDVDHRAATPEDQQDSFPGLASDDSLPPTPLPLEPDYSPGGKSPRAPTEKAKAKKR